MFSLDGTLLVFTVFTSLYGVCMGKVKVQLRPWRGVELSIVYEAGLAPGQRGAENLVLTGI